MLCEKSAWFSGMCGKNISVERVTNTYTFLYDKEKYVSSSHIEAFTTTIKLKKYDYIWYEYFLCKKYLVSLILEAAVGR